MSDKPDLVTALRAVLPHASRDRFTPILHGVLVRNDRLVATDRYTVARAAFEPVGDLIGLDRDIVIGYALAKFIVARKRDALTELTVDGDRITATFESGMSFSPAPVEAYGVDGKPLFPLIDNRLFDDFEPQDDEHPGPDRASFSRWNLTKFSPGVMGGSVNDSVEIQLDRRALKPARFSVYNHEWLDVLVVPVRVEAGR